MSLPYNQPFNQYKLSSIPGVVLDCVVATGLKIGGGTATDNTAAINAFFAQIQFSTVPVELIWDGGTVMTGLILPAAGNVKITGIGWNSGIYIKSASNSDAINNGKILPFNPGVVPPAQAGYIHLSNFMINGNRGNGTTGNSNSGNPRGITGTYWYTNIHFWNLSGVRIDNMYIYDAPAYSILLDNCSDVAITRCTIINPNTVAGFNNDCIHINGPYSDVRILGNYLNNNFSDDAVALNTAEGYGGVGSRATVVGNTFKNVASALRAYGGTLAGSTTTGSMDAVIFSGNVGNTSADVIVLGGGDPSTGDNEGPRIFIGSGNSFQCGGNYLIVGGNSGDYTLSDCVWSSPTAAGAWINPQLAGTISSITVNNLRTYRSTDGSNTGTSLLAAAVTCTINRLTINGFYVINEEGQSYAAIANMLVMASLTITKLFVANLDMTLITALADSYTNIGSMSGPGLGSQTVAKTAAYTILPTDGTVFVDATLGATSVTLPVKQYAGHEVKVVKTDVSANAVTLVGTISGAVNPTLAAQYSKARFETSGSVWYNV